MLLQNLLDPIVPNVDFLPFRNSRLSHRDSEELSTVQVDAQGVSFRKNSISILPSPNTEGPSSNVNELEETISRLKGNYLLLIKSFMLKGKFLTILLSTTSKEMATTKYEN